MLKNGVLLLLSGNKNDYFTEHIIRKQFNAKGVKLTVEIPFLLNALVIRSSTWESVNPWWSGSPINLNALHCRLSGLRATAVLIDRTSEKQQMGLLVNDMYEH